MCIRDSPNTTNDREDGNCNCAGIALDEIICRTDVPAVINGNNNEWTQVMHPIANTLLGSVSSTSDLSSSFQMSWDDGYLYISGLINDDVLVNDSAKPWLDDSVELYIDGGNEKQTSYDQNDYSFIFRYNDPNVHYVSTNPDQTNPTGVDFQMVPGQNFYTIEIRIAWSLIGTASNVDEIGFDIHINDDDNGDIREAKIAWHATVDDSWMNPSLFKTVKRIECDGCEHTISLLSNPITTDVYHACLLYTSPSPRDATLSRMPSSA